MNIPFSSPLEDNVVSWVEVSVEVHDEIIGC